MSLFSFLGTECRKESTDTPPTLCWEPAAAPDPQRKRWGHKPCPVTLRQLQSQATEYEGDAAGRTDLLPDQSVSMATRGSMFYEPESQRLVGQKTDRQTITVTERGAMLSKTEGGAAAMAPCGLGHSDGCWHSDDWLI